MWTKSVLWTLQRGMKLPLQAALACAPGLVWRIALDLEKEGKGKPLNVYYRFRNKQQQQ